jgi:phosphoglycolate phosphatase
VSKARFDLVVFDLDGTLVDSRRDLAESANAVLEHYGCPPHSEEEIGRMVGDGAATLVHRAFTTAGCPQPPDALDRFLSIYNRRLLMFTRPYDGIPELLADLEGRTVLAVCTNKPLAPTQRILDELGLSAHFGHRVVGGDGPWPRKPDPAGLRSLIDAAGVLPATTILVGDSVIDWETAHAAGTHVCMARYGFGFDAFPRQRLTVDDGGVDQPRELSAVLSE